MHGNTEINIADHNWSAYVRARDAGHLDYIEVAERCDNFYHGEQWTTADRTKLEAAGRPVLTINTVLSTINTVLGEQSAKRADVLLKPRRMADEATAEAFTYQLLQIQDNNRYEWLESEVFADGNITGRGFFDCRIDFSDNVLGEVRLTALDPYDVLLDAGAKEYDPNTWREVITSRWLSIDEIAELYGKARADQLEVSANAGQGYGKDSVWWKRNTFAQDAQAEVESYDEEESRSLYRVRIIERQYKKMTLVKYFVDPEIGDMREVPVNWSEGRVAEVQAKFGLLIHKIPRTKIRWTVTADQTVLHDDWSPYKRFTVVPYFPYWRRGRPFGMVQNLLSPQEMLNKIASQELHVVNTTANSGWMIEEGSLVGMDDDELEEQGARTGLVVKYRKGSTPPEKIKPNQVPTGLDRIGLKALDHIREISGVNRSVLGLDNSDTSGVAIEAKQSRGMVQMQVPFDNLDRTRRYLFEHVVELVQQFYTEERVFKVIDFRDPNKGQKEVAINAMKEDGTMLNDLTVGEYDLIIASTPAKDTFQDTQFAQAVALKQAGVVIPDDAIIEYSGLQRKHELADRVRKMMGEAPPSEEEQELLDFQKEIMMRTALAELKELESKVEENLASALLHKARAGDLERSEMGEDEISVQMAGFQSSLRETREKIEADLANAAEERRLKRELAIIDMREAQKDRVSKAETERFKARESAKKAARKPAK